MTTRILFAAFFLATASAEADVVSPHPDRVGVTFYHQGDVSTALLMHADQNPWIRDSGYAFITETRTVDLPAGPAILKFQGVASSMVPQTASIYGLPAGVLERNFDYDLLSSGSLLAKSIGETVRLVRTDSRSGKLREESAIIRSGPEGAVLEIGGKLEALQCSGLPEKLVFDHVPGGLADTPTLTVHTVSPVAGRYTVTLSYIATGLNWSADYVARVVPGSDRLALTGWLTLANFSTTSFPDAPIDVVAGSPETTGQDHPIDSAPLVLATRCWPTNIDWGKYPAVPLPPPPPPPAPMVENVLVTAERRHADMQSVPIAVTALTGQEFGDYILYPLPEPTTVAAQQTKQVQFLDQPDVPFERIYRYDMDGSTPNRATQTARPSVVLRLQNRAESGLGKPLPAGSVAVFEQGDSPVFAGQARIADMAVGLPVEVETGRAQDVMVTRRLVHSEETGEGRFRTMRNEWDVTLANAKSVPVQIELRQSLLGGRGEITSESLDHISEYGLAVWRPKLAAGQRLVIHFILSVSEARSSTD